MEVDSCITGLLGCRFSFTMSTHSFNHTRTHEAGALSIIYMSVLALSKLGYRGLIFHKVSHLAKWQSDHKCQLLCAWDGA